MNEILNPYIAGAPVVENSMFFGREDIFKWIERSLAGKYIDHILVLHGQRRVGKTSVLKQIPNYLPKHYIQVFFDLQGRTSTTLDRFLWWMANEIVRTLKKERDISLPKPDHQAFEDTEYLINDFLPSLRPILGEQVLLLTFDEFDSLDRPEIRESLANPLISYLRRLIEMEGLNFIFSIGSSGDKLENMQASYTDFFKSALYRKISFLTNEDCYRLITKPVENLIRYDRKAVDQIIQITSGHPYFTQLMCHELFSHCQKTGRREISVQDVDGVLGDVIERGTVNLKFVWDEASDLEKWVLAALAHSDSATTQQLAEVLTAQRVRFSEPDLNSAVIHLQDKDVLTKDLRFVIHLMRLWLKANRPMERVREELAEVNPIANRYMEIGDEYRDRGQNQAAIDSYLQALAIDPDNLRAQLNTAALYLEQEDYPEAAEAFELAMKIDDEDVVARAGYCDANLALGDAAQKDGDTEQAKTHYQAILVVNPAHADARQRLATIYQEQAENFLTAGKDDAALQAFNQALIFTPDDDDLVARHAQVMADKKAKVLKTLQEKAEKATADEAWQEVIQACESYLALEPGANTEITQLLDHARKYAKLDEEYEKAQQAIKSKHFGQAIELLQGIIAQDPAYRSTLRLLAEAVEASKAKDPIWRKPWFFGSIAAVVIIALGVIFGPQVWNAISKPIANQPAEATKTIPTNSPQSASPTPEDMEKYIWMAKVQPLMAWMDEIVNTPPTFIEDFSITQPYWNDMYVNQNIAITDYVTEGAFHIVEEPSELSEYVYRFPWDVSSDFLLLFNFTPNELPFGSHLNVYFRSFANFRIQSNGDWELSFNSEQGLEIDSGTTADLNANHTYQLQVLAWQDQVAILLDGKTLTYAEEIPISTGNFEIRIDSYKPIDVELDNIELWDFSRMELYELFATPPSEFNQAQSFYQPIREYLAVAPPTFQEDFETQKPYWEDIQLFGPEYNFTTLASQIFDGTLQINPTLAAVENGAPFNLQFPEMHGENIALQFDFRFNNPDPYNQVAVLNFRNPGVNFDFEGYHFYCDFYRDDWNIGCSFNTWNNVENGSEIQQHSIQMYKDLNSYFTMLVVYYNAQWVAFLDGFFIGYADQLELVNQKISISTFSDESLEIEFDNIKFWNLDGIDIDNFRASSSGETTFDYEQILNYVWTELPITFEDDFSTANAEWGTDFDGRAISSLIQDEVLIVDNRHSELIFPTSGLFDAENFALSFDFFPGVLDQPENGSIGVEFLSSGFSGSEYYKFKISYSASSPGTDGWLYSQSDASSYKTTDTGVVGISLEGFTHVQFLVWQGNFAVFINGELVHTDSNLQTWGKSVYFVKGGEVNSRLSLDNVTFWNLDGVEINQ